MDFKSFYQGLDAEARARFAKTAGTSTGYIEVHLMTRRKIPKPPLMSSLAAACREFGAPVSHEDLLAFFYRTSASGHAAAA